MGDNSIHEGVHERRAPSGASSGSRPCVACRRRAQRPLQARRLQRLGASTRWSSTHPLRAIRATSLDAPGSRPLGIRSLNAASRRSPAPAMARAAPPPAETITETAVSCTSCSMPRRPASPAGRIYAGVGHRPLIVERHDRRVVSRRERALVRHGGGEQRAGAWLPDRAEGIVVVSAEVDGRELVVRVADDGVGWAPRADSPGWGWACP
jgi:hypothetical protein